MGGEDHAWHGCERFAHLTATAIVAANLRVDGKPISDAASGPPLQVASSVLVDDLNADMLDGLDAADLVTHMQLDQTAVREALFTTDGVFEVPQSVNLLELIVMLIGGGGGVRRSYCPDLAPGLALESLDYRPSAPCGQETSTVDETASNM